MPHIISNYRSDSFRALAKVSVTRVSMVDINAPSNRGRFIPAGNLVFPYRALFDTGASKTAISARVIREAQLTRAGSIQMTSASETTFANAYRFSVKLLFTQEGAEKAEEAQRIVYSSHAIRGVKFHTEETTQFDVLLGMDIISQGSLKLDPDGHFSFCL